MSVPFHKQVKHLLPGDVIVGSKAGVTTVIDTAYATMKTGYYTVTTEFGDLILEPDMEMEIE